MHKCDKCGAEATVHDFKLAKGGIMHQVHLCDDCANKLGVANKQFQTLDELVQSAAAPAGGQLMGGARGEAGAAVCPGCGMAWSEFREKGQLGCAACYDAFGEQISALVERMHEGGTHHVGKTPTKADRNESVELRVQHLRKQLADALAAEQYEKAAEIRDRLSTMGRVIRPAESSTEADASGGQS